MSLQRLLYKYTLYKENQKAETHSLWQLLSANFNVLLIFTGRKRSLGQGNVFTGVCLSTGGISLPACIRGHMIGGSLSRGVSVQRRSLSRGSLSKGRALCPNKGGLCPGASYGNEWVVSILLEYILVISVFLFLPFATVVAER